MNINDFVNKFAAQFDETPADEITAQTAFREIEEWSSMLALSIIAMVDDEYQVLLTGEHIRSSKTVQEVFDKVEALTQA